ncbi:carbamoyltransferase family protein [Streptomyces aidingensis]|uniref:Carbamoyltransferase n=1 Tax=Streptomyces aidingensis TaxID=910347 RepID=A0A1I1T3N4_9ACTN|nr:carbamoyltransferase C-terminal domain-containing protein [Streptomyces aidingensis]SFD53305.1 carbamoyltransferase [Streptomyces aidingensis]
MLVLGISGLDRASALKKKMLPGLDWREQRLVQGLDSAAALVDENGVVAASAQERHDGDKGTGAFPADAVAACLRMAGATLDDVDLVAHGFRYTPSPTFELDDYLRRWYREVYSEEVQREVLGAHYPDQDWRRKLVRVPHHLAHAASSYHLSGFADATVLVADAMGESESTSLFRGDGGQLRSLRGYPVSASLGILYSVVTQYLGFLPGMDEYKVMGLAPYGDPGAFPDAGPLVTHRPGGRLTVPLLAHDRTPEERETHRGAIRRLEELFGPARHPDAPVEQRHMDIAAVLQRALERSLLFVLTEGFAATGAEPSRNLCMAGGVALNCTANGLIARSGLFDDVFVQPAAGDDGTALGAALHVLREHVPSAPRPMSMTMPYWGEEFGEAETERALETLGPGHRVRRLADGQLLKEVSALIGSGAVVAWYQGRMEFGPRALGNRSILADPAAPGMRAHLNAVVKQREEFRPFAPAVAAEEAGEYFEIEPGRERLYRHMLFVTQVREKYRDRLPAITHVDGSARVQVVERDSAPRFHALIRRLGDDLGIPMVLNTSFNLKGQPIVRTPLDAVATYARSTLDALAIGDWLVVREPAGPAGTGGTDG